LDFQRKVSDKKRRAKPYSATVEVQGYADETGAKAATEKFVRDHIDRIGDF